jgi:hypothetical protein
MTDWLDVLLLEQTEREKQRETQPSHPGTSVPSLYELCTGGEPSRSDMDCSHYLRGRYATPGKRLGVQGLPRTVRRHENGDCLAYFYDLH